MWPLWKFQKTENRVWHLYMQPKRDQHQGPPERQWDHELQHDRRLVVAISAWSYKGSSLYSTSLEPAMELTHCNRQNRRLEAHKEAIQNSIDPGSHNFWGPCENGYPGLWFGRRFREFGDPQYIIKIVFTGDTWSISGCQEFLWCQRSSVIPCMIS